MSKNLYGKKIKKITGLVMAFSMAMTGILINNIVRYTKTEVVYAHEASDFNVKVKTDKDDTGYLQERVGQIIFVETLITGGVGEKQYKYEIKNSETGVIEKSTDYKDCYEEWGMFGVVLTSVGERELVVYIKDEEGNVTKSEPYIIDAIEGELDAGIFLDEEVTLRGYNVGDTVELSIVAGGGSLFFILYRVIVSVIPTVIGVLIFINGLTKLQTALDARRINKDKSLWMIIMAVIVIIVGAFAIINPFGLSGLVLRVLGIILMISGITDLVSFVILNKKIKNHIKDMEALEQ